MSCSAMVMKQHRLKCIQAFLGILFVFHLLFLIFRVQEPRLYTRLSLASSVLSTVATLVATVQSFMEDERSIQPSDMLVLYFSGSSVLSIPRLRSLWLMPSLDAPKALWTTIFVITTIVAFVESLKKTKILRPTHRGVSLEELTGFWGKSFFIWVLPLFQAGYSKLLQLDDLPRIDTDLQGKSTWTDLDKAWAQIHGRHRLFRAALLASLWPVLSAVLPRLSLAAFSFCQPFLVNASVSYLTTGKGKNDDTKVYGPALVGAFILVYLGIAVTRAVYWRQTYRLITRIRSALTAQIYQKTTDLRARDVSDSAAVTLMGTDVERIVDALAQFHELWASLLEVGVATWLLARQISYAALVPLVVCVVSVLAASHVAARFGPAQRMWNERVQERIAVTIRMLADVKAVKMLGLTGVLADLILKLRAIELDTSEKFRILRIWRIMISNAPATVAPLVTFAAYAVIAVVKKNETLLSAQAFTSLSLISLLTRALLILCQALPTFFQAVTCFERIEAYCTKPGIIDWSITEDTDSSDLPEDETELRVISAPPTSGESLAIYDQADISWSDDGSSPVLQDINLKISRGFTAIIGPVASGKSTLLASIIGETTLRRGHVTLQTLSGVAFCSQTPWLINDTVRQNITGGLDLDHKWYDYALYCSCLEDDVAGMSHGDHTTAGSNGSSLSGGQRQRVALARAVYSRLPIVVLDDVTSGLDSETTSKIIKRLFEKEGYFRKSGINVIIATHNRRLLSLMDSIVVLDKGHIVGHGSFTELSLGSGRDRISEEVEETTLQDIKTDEPADLANPPSTGVAAMIPDVTSLNRRGGNWATYRYYFRSAGFLTLCLWAAFTLLGAVATSLTTVWVDIWTDANEKKPNQNLGLYTGVYTLLVILANVGPLGECWIFFINIINQTATKMHSDLLQTVSSAPYSVFQKTDTGSITNRFSQDMDLIDMRLPTNAIQFTTGATTCIVELVVLCVLGKYFTAAVPVLVAALFVVQRYYLRTSRQVRLIDIEAKAPLYKHFVETIQGVATIRAFRWKVAFNAKQAEILDQAQRPFYMLFCIQQWLQLILDLIVGALAVIIVALATSATTSLSDGALGVALVLVLQLNSSLTQTIQSWTHLETSIGAAARVKQFVQETPAEDPGVENVPADWPHQGAIRFQNVTAHYTPEGPPALANLSLDIQPGEKIALCGPSGSGKSTSIMAILRMIDVSDGDIIIDNKRVSMLSGNGIRSQLNVVPQDPFFMPGSIRFNLDPHDRATSELMESAVRMVGLWDRVACNGTSDTSNTWLDSELNGAEWSQGERQLLCLARALLHPSKVVILDECTSSVDEHTEAIMQELIDTQLRDRTIVSIMHRFRYIDRFDRVAVLRKGELVECDTPQALLGRQSAFRDLYVLQNDIKTSSS